jgi:cytoskeletal protein RodZ
MCGHFVKQHRLLLFALSSILWLVAGGVVLPNAVTAQRPSPFAQEQSVTSPLDTPRPEEPPTNTPTPSPTVTSTPTETATPTTTPTPTAAPFQISPLIVQSGGSPPDSNGAMIWIAAASLLILAGSVVMLVADRRDRQA